MQTWGRRWAGRLGLRKERRYLIDYEPEPGRRSEKAERLVDFCLGDPQSRMGRTFTPKSSYEAKNSILRFEATHGHLVISRAGIHRPRDQKKVVRALMTQRAAIPDRLRCWLVRGDGAGKTTNPKRGLHITGMRPADRRDLVLVPTACRQRFLGPRLARQMEELRASWVPWEEKSDVAWWGGALTGDWWFGKEPHVLTRREVLCHFRDHPSDRVRLQLTRPGDNVELPPGMNLAKRFTKGHAYTHKCLVLLPGNDIASGSSWFFCGNSVVLMPPPHLEHILYFEMEPWQHYVPLESDPADILVKLQWVLDHPDDARRIVANSHERLRWLCGPEYLWACNEVLRRIASPT